VPRHYPARTRPFPTLSSDLSSDGRTDHPEAIGEGLFELRLKGAEGIARVFFCTLIRRRIVMLHSFVKKTKKTKKTPLREIEIERKRMQEIKDENS